MSGRPLASGPLGGPGYRGGPAAGHDGTGPAGIPDARLAAAVRDAARFFRERLPGSWVPGYLADRGLDAAIQRPWQAGYAPAEWDALVRHLRAAGYGDTVLEAAGLAHRSRRGALIDTFRDRAVLPIRDAAGTIVAFIGRAPGGAAPGVPKYLNSPGTRLYRKRETLFGLAESRGLLACGARPTIVEGPLDAIAVTLACGGRFAGLSPCGIALTSEQITALGRCCDLATAGVLVAFDPDAAGRGAAVAAYHLLAVVTGALTVAPLAGGEDPAQILRGHGSGALARALGEGAQPLADLALDAEVGKWSRWLRFPEGQTNALHAAARLIAGMPPEHVARQVARLAQRLGLDYPAVTDAVTQAVTDAGPLSRPRP